MSKNEFPPDAVQASVQQLDQAITATCMALVEFKEHQNQLNQATVNLIREGLTEIQARRQRKELYVAVVGEQKAGKSTLLNAILGMELLGTAVRECTGAVSFLRCGTRPGYQVGLRSGLWEDFCERCPDRHEEFAQQVAELSRIVERCKTEEQQFPADLLRLDQTLRQLRTAHDSLVEQAANADRFTADRRRDAEQTRKELNDFQEALRRTEQHVPWPYRQAGDWTFFLSGLGRVILKPWEKPSWHDHLTQVKTLRQAQKNLLTVMHGVQSAADTTAALEQRTLQNQEKIRELLQREETTKQALLRLPAVYDDAQTRLQQAHKDWRQHQEDRLASFVQAVKELTDMNRRGNDVEELHLELSSDRLPERIVLIDTPGVNTATEENRERAWRAIRSYADACILVADLGQPLSESTREFVRQVREVTPHILLVLTKLDAVLQSAELNSDDAQREVEEAIRIGRARFASEVGRSEQEILTFAVAARPALKQKSGSATELFRQELARLFSIVEAERAIAVTAKCAQIIHHVQQTTLSESEEIEATYRNRIESLVAQQINHPQEVRDRAIVTLIPAIRKLSEPISQMLRVELQERLSAFHQRLKQPLEAAKNSHELGLAIQSLENDATHELDQIAEACQQRTSAQFAPAIEELIRQARQPIWDRYQLSQSMATAAPPRPTIAIPVISAAVPLSLTSLGADVQQKVKQYTQRSNTLGNAVMKSGTRALTTNSSSGLTFALLGIAAGTVWGITHGQKFPALKQECLAKIDGFLAELVREATSERFIGPLEIEHHLGRQLTTIVDHDLHAFRVWIDSVIQSERRTLANEQKRLAHLRDLRNRLATHDQRLQNLLEKATEVCLGLSRSARTATT